MTPLKVVFALEYVMQGLANPFQGITYQPFFKHFRVDYGLSEAATQRLFAKSYLAWSFKPLLGFLIDAYGRTRVLLIALLSLATLGFLLAPLVDRGVLVFFGFMFALSIVMAATDVAVDRATVIEGDEESKATGRPKATTVGLNQAICWSAIYGTSIVAAVAGGYVADNVPLGWLMALLALVPLAVLSVVLLVPRDEARPVPLAKSFKEFWHGLNTGPILGVMAFYFIFHFQPALGPLWNNHLIENLKFSQTEVGIGDGASYGGYFVGVLLFAWQGVKWQERLGMQKVFRIFILASVALNLTQYLLVDPWFSAVAQGLHGALPFLDEGTVRLVYLSAYNALLAIMVSIIRMSTFSLVGAVIPVAAAGSLFAGFMSVANLAYSFSYSSGAWLYDHGMEFTVLRELQNSLFGIGGGVTDHLSIQVLILIGSLAYLLSFAAVRLLPDREATLASGDAEGAVSSIERWNVLSKKLRRTIDLGILCAGLAAFFIAIMLWEIDFVSASLLCFFGLTAARKWLLDGLARRSG